LASVFSALGQHAFGLFSAFMRNAKQCASSFLGFWGFSIEYYARRFAHAAHGDARFLKPEGNSPMGDAMFLSQNLNRITGNVTRDDFGHRKIDSFPKVEGSLGFIPDFDAGIAQSTPNSCVGNLELLCEINGIDPRKVKFGQLINIKNVPFSGHVYNLSTEDGWYVADGIVTHNCSYRYIYSPSELPPGMLTEKGKAKLREARAAIRGLSDAT
jgi:curved DNA-binding protein CbpA